MSAPRMSEGEKRWPCMTCGDPIRVNPYAGLGEPRYVHAVPARHLALRGPKSPTPDQEKS